MEKRINVAEILRNCPKGMELDCVCFENVVFDRVDDKNRIRCLVGSQRDEVSFNEYGCLNGSPSAKCVIFPVSETSWEEWELVPDKFDINSLVPFESRVLVRNAKTGIWKPAILGCYAPGQPDYHYVLGGISWFYCIP